MKHSWNELRPFRVGEDSRVSRGDANMHRILDHIERFLLVISRDSGGKVRVHIRAGPRHRSTLDGLEGMEAVPCKSFDFAGYTVYSRYSLRRHCSVPIAHREAQRTSLYRTLGLGVPSPAYLAIYARKMDTSSAITAYIRCIERGLPPEGILRHISAGSARAKVSSRGRARIKDAQEKLAGRLLFCKMSTGASSASEEGAIQGVLPARAFAAKRSGYRAVSGAHSGRLSPPWLGGSKSIILSDVELLSFLSMPDDSDMENINFEFGRLQSGSAGLRDGSIR
ncbi:hypothetical protein CENSYa_0689 [Cenarchaeum symbiosum A]|uniref:Uncharacterized protein n=1 Tax=Cenarchaeum symbiosum (strain A) TaxID=414004 RepID=A0RVF5_CENSY|nr:hypothetical protein CENSYa_0689 [Cenarchaeum symbiosum A]